VTVSISVVSIPSGPPSVALFLLIVFRWSLFFWLWLLWRLRPSPWLRRCLLLPVAILVFFVARLALTLGLHRRRGPRLRMRPLLLLCIRLRSRFRSRLWTLHIAVVRLSRLRLNRRPRRLHFWLRRLRNLAFEGSRCGPVHRRLRPIRHGFRTINRHFRTIALCHRTGRLYPIDRRFGPSHGLRSRAGRLVYRRYGTHEQLILPLCKRHGRLYGRVLRNDLAVDDIPWGRDRGRTSCSHHTAANRFDPGHAANRRLFNLALLHRNDVTGHWPRIHKSIARHGSHVCLIDIRNAIHGRVVDVSCVVSVVDGRHLGDVHDGVGYVDLIHGSYVSAEIGSN
jgi:hypothetical protein